LNHTCFILLLGGSVGKCCAVIDVHVCCGVYACSVHVQMQAETGLIRTHPE